jgi:hypothetical protein
MATARSLGPTRPLMRARGSLTALGMTKLDVRSEILLRVDATQVANVVDHGTN